MPGIFAVSHLLFQNRQSSCTIPACHRCKKGIHGFLSHKTKQVTHFTLGNPRIVHDTALIKNTHGVPYSAIRLQRDEAKRIRVCFNTGFGGKVNAPFHEEYVFYQPTLTARMPDGSQRVIIDSGKLLV